MTTTKNLLLYLYCVKYRTDWDATLKHIQERFPLPSNEEIEQGVNQFMFEHPEFVDAIDITSVNYPKTLKTRPCPPFVVFKKENNIFAFYDKFSHNELVEMELL